jgi:hypothetical protein
MTGSKKHLNPTVGRRKRLPHKEPARHAKACATMPAPRRYVIESKQEIEN